MIKKIFFAACLFFLLSYSFSFAQDFGNALNFDGNNDYVEIPFFERPGTMTIEAWVRIEDESSTKMIVGWAGNGNSAEFVVCGNGLSYCEFDGTTFPCVSGGSLNLNQWHHVAVVRSGSGTNNVKVYVDGNLRGTGSVNNNYTTTNSLMIGAYGFSSPSGRNFNGDIDDVRIWRTERTGSEIQANSSVESAGLNGDLIAAYDFNAGFPGRNNSGVRTLQDKANEFDATLNSFGLTGSSSNWVKSQGPDAPTISLSGSISHIPKDATIEIPFDGLINSPNASNVLIWGNQSGIIPGIYSGGGTSTLSFKPNYDLRAGETVRISVTPSLGVGKHHYIFTVATDQASHEPAYFRERKVIESIRTLGVAAVGDVNDDGMMDIVSTNFSTGIGVSGSIIWFDGANDYSPTSIPIPVGFNDISPSVRDIDLVDIDEDGRLDILAVVNSPINQVIWFRQNSGGGFDRNDISFVGFPLSADVGDIDSDGDLDIVIQSLSDGSLRLLTNNSNSFSSQVLASPNDQLVDLISADFDKDGDVDIVAAGQSNDRLILFKNNGGQSFAEIDLSEDASGTRDIELVDMDNDLDLDIVSASSSENTVQIFYNDGSEQDLEFEDNETSSPWSVAVGDLDGDGDYDLVSGSSKNPEIIWMKNENIPFEQFEVDIADPDVSKVYQADMDADGDLDLVVAGDFLSIYENTRQPLGVPLVNSPTVTQEENIIIDFNQPVSTTLNPNDIRVKGEFNGFKDVSIEGLGTSSLTLNTSGKFDAGEKITLYVNESFRSLQGSATNPGFFQQFNTIVSPVSQVPVVFNKQEIISEKDIESAYDQKVYDIDSDGDLDIIGAFSGNLVIKINDGNFNFSDIQVIDENISVTYKIRATDLDRDGFGDIIIADFDSGPVWYRNDQNGGFVKFPIPNSYTDPYFIEVTDIDGDSYEDIIVGYDDGRALAWYNHQPDGSFPEIELYFDSDVNAGSFSYINSVNAADVDLDGDVDLVVSSYQEGTVELWYNEGNGNFSSDIIESDVVRVRNSLAEDMDNDGDIDIISGVESNTNSVVIHFKNDDNTNFTKAVISTDKRIIDIDVNDIDGDGWMDIVAANLDDDQIDLFLNQQNGTFVEYLANDGTNGAWNVEIVDFDKDGDLDIMSSELLGDDINFHENVSALTEFLSYGFGESVGESEIDIESKTISLIVASGTELDSLVAEFEVSKGANLIIEDEDNETIPQISGDTPNDFTEELIYTVIAEDGRSQSEWKVNVEILPDIPVIQDSLTSIGQDTIQFSWNPVEGANGYLLDILSNDKITVITEEFEINDTTTTIRRLSQGFDFYLYLRSYNSLGPSSSADSIIFNTIPATPTARSATVVTLESYLANWDPVTGADFYRLEVARDELFENIIFEDTTSSLSLKVENLLVGTGYWYRVFSNNLTGQSLPSNFISVETDSRPLQLSDPVYNPVFNTNDNESIVTFSVTDGLSQKQVLFRHRGISSLDWIENPLESDSLDQYSFAIQPDMLDDVGLEFEIEVDDGQDNRVNGNNYIFSGFTNDQSPTIPITSFGGNDENWQIISIPYKLESNLIESIFNELSELNYRFDWRLMHYRNESYVDAGSGFNTIDIGLGYWYNSKQDIAIQIGDGTTNDEVPYEIILTQGWNQIGNPYNISISWSSVLESNNTGDEVSPLVTYSNMSFSEGDIMEPFSGGFVWSDQVTTINIDPAENKSNGGSRLKKEVISNKNIDKNEWLIPLGLKIGDVEQKIGGVGMHVDAQIDKDPFDRLIVPRFYRYLELYTTHEDFFYPWFNQDVVKTSDRYTWDFDFEANVGEGIADLQWDQESLSRSVANLWLVDNKKGKVINMKEVSSYSISLSGKHSLTIHYTRDPEEVIVPQQIILGDAYPNPATDLVKIPITFSDLESSYNMTLDIIDIQGKVVKTITSDSLKPGFYEFIWNLSDSNEEINGGLYLYRISFENQNLAPQMKKIMIQR